MAWQSIQVEAEHLVTTVDRLIAEGFEQGKIRRIRLRQGDHVLFEIPLVYGLGIGLVAAAVAPVLAAVGAVAAMVTHCTVEIERADSPENGTSPQSRDVYPPSDTPPTGRAQ